MCDGVQVMLSAGRAREAEDRLEEVVSAMQQRTSTAQHQACEQHILLLQHFMSRRRVAAHASCLPFNVSRSIAHKLCRHLIHTRDYLGVLYSERVCMLLAAVERDAAAPGLSGAVAR